MSKKKAIILLTVFIDVLGIGLIIPILPFYVKSFGASPLTITLLFAAFSFFAFFSAPLLGAWSDKQGRRPALIVSIFSTALGWLIFAAAPNIIFLFIGRIIDGAAAGNFSVAQSYLIDIAKDEKEKTASLGLIGAIFGIGLIIGPALGGILSQISLAFPFWCVGALAILNGFFVVFFLPETNLQKNKDQQLSLNPVRPIIKALRDRRLRSSLAAWFIFGIAIAIEHSVLALYLEGVFNFNSFIVSLFLTGIGVILVINQGFALKKIWLKYFQETSLNIWLSLILAFGFWLMSLKYLILFISGLIIMSIIQSVLRVTITSQTAKHGAPQEQGAILGVLASIISVSMIIGPILAGWLFTLNQHWPFIMSGFLAALAFLILFSSRPRESRTPLSEKELLVAQQRIDFVD